jgi:hypothetical protein
MTKKYLPLVLKGLAIAGICAGPAYAQVNKSSLTGVVSDSSGASLPGVVIRLTNVGTGAGRTETTDTSGLYRFTLLDNGTYHLEAELSGFQKVVRESIQLETGQTTTVDLTMALEEVKESIDVRAESPLLRTETGSSGTTVTTQVLNELPLIGRNPYAFLTLSPGIQYTGNPAAVNQWDNNGPSGFTSSGSSATSEFLLDGIPNMRIDRVSFSPPPDAVQEMRVQTNAYDAEYGHSGAAFVNVSTRGGSNQTHGSAYWFLRDDSLNANSFFNNRNGQPKGDRSQHTYGGALGGPVQIPNLYNGTNRTFYYMNFEGSRIRGDDFARAIVPTRLERSGDFSQTRDLQGRPVTIYDPATTRPNPSGTGFIRDPFPGNVIPPDRMDPVALRALAYYPLPNLARTATNQENFENPRQSGLDWSSVSTRVDHRLSDSHNLFFRFGRNRRFDPSSPFYGNDCCRAAGDPTGGQDEFSRGNIAAGVGYTWIVSPRTVADVRVGFTRYFDADSVFGEGFDIATLGFPATFTDSVAFRTFPRFEMDGDVESLGTERTSGTTFVNQYNALVNVHSNFGRHSVKYGFRYQVAQQNVSDPDRASGEFQFDRMFTQGPDPTRSATNSGHDFASFLLGTPSSGSVDTEISPALQNEYYAGYVQDDWKVTNRLTLNLGLRFEHEAPVTERFDRGSAGFDFSAANPLAARAQANYAANPIPELAELNVRGGLQFLAADGAPRGNLNMASLLLAPRFGYALRLTDSIVWRGGYGLFYLPNNVSNYRRDGFSLSTQMVTSLDDNLTPFNRLSDPFPTGLVQPPGAAGGLLTGTGQSLTAGGIATDGKVPDYKHGMSHQFSTGFQVVLPGRVSLEMSYVGNVSRRLPITRDINEVPDEFLALGTRLNARVPNPFHGVITDPRSALSQPTTTVSQLLKPFPQYVDLTQSVLPDGRSTYHALQVQATKRLADGLTFGGAYTFSKYMEATSFLNANDPAPERVIAEADRPHRLVLYGLYELPFGPGKRFAATNNPVLKHILGGWQVNWVGTFQSGEALEIEDAERAFKSEANPRTVDQWFDVEQFVVREPFTLRELSTRIADLRAPGIHKWDVTLMKAFQIKEGVRLQFRVELYNAFNRTHFGTPNDSVTSSNFGRITGTLLGPREIQLAMRLVF